MQISTVIFVVLAAIVSTWIGTMWYDNYNKCSKTYIHKTCDAYVTENVTYNKLCESICVQKDNFIIEDCLLSTTFNKSVFLATIEGKQVILKVDMLWFNHMKDAEKSLESQTSFFNATEYFRKIVFKNLGDNCTNCRELVTKLLTMADTDTNGVISTQEATWFGSLLLTQETFMLAAMNGTKSTVNLYGFCGALYNVQKVQIASSQLIDTEKTFTDFWSLPEFAEPLESFIKDILGDMRDTSPTFLALHEYIYILYKKVRKDTVPTLEQRVDYVIGMIELVYDLVSFQYGEMIWCDILFDNTGLSNLSNFSLVKLTDLDEVFATAKVPPGERTKNVKPCTTDIDCSHKVDDIERTYYQSDCSISFCQDVGFCSQRMKKDNLAYLCNTIFFDVFFNPVTVALSDEKLSSNVALVILQTLRNCRRPVLYSNAEEKLLFIRKVAEQFQSIKQLLNKG